MGVCLRYSANKEEAEDILQEGFIKIFQCLKQYKSAGSFEGWIRKIIVNTSLQKYRNNNYLHAIVSLDDEFIDDETFIDNEMISGLSAKELLKMIQLLPPGYRMAFNLYSFEGLKHREIAALLNVSEGTSKSNLHAARSILKRSLQNIVKYDNTNIIINEKTYT